MPARTKKRGHSASPSPSSFRDLLDVILTLAVVFPLILRTLVTLILRRWSTTTELSVGEDIKLSLMRSLDSLPSSLKRRLLQSDTKSILDSPRFRGIRSRLQIEVSRPGFEGYWLYKAPLAELTRKDAVLFWIHGGAYTLGDAFMGFTLLLRVMEVAAQQGISLSIFSLDYTLAPHAQFPQQQQEAIAAYRYLLQDQGIDARRIVIGGESAGAHVALTALLAIEDAGLPKPGGALFLYPWVNLKNSGGSTTRNKHLDMLSKDSLDRAVELAVGPDGQEKHATLIDLAAALPEGRSWAKILPAVTRVNIGSHDLFVDDVGLFVNHAREDGANIHLEVTPKMSHGWQMIGNVPNEKAYCAMSPESPVAEGLLPGSENVANHFLEIMKSIRD